MGASIFIQFQYKSHQNHLHQYSSNFHINHIKIIFISGTINIHPISQHKLDVWPPLPVSRLLQTPDSDSSENHRKLKHKCFNCLSNTDVYKEAGETKEESLQGGLNATRPFRGCKSCADDLSGDCKSSFVDCCCFCF